MVLVPRSRRPVRRVEEYAADPMRRDVWPATLAPVRQLLDHGLDLDTVTVLVGENGAGKSTLVEAVALAFGMGPEGGSTMSGTAPGRASRRCGSTSRCTANPERRRAGSSCGRRPCTGSSRSSSSTPVHRPEPVFHERSHGESFLDFVIDRSQWPGLWVLDEPESALSFQGCLALIGLLQAIVDDGLGQVLLSTHSPVLAAFPGATIHEVGEWGLRRSAWADLDLVRHQRAFLTAPERYLRHLDDERGGP